MEERGEVERKGNRGNTEIREEGKVSTVKKKVREKEQSRGEVSGWMEL